MTGSIALVAAIVIGAGCATVENEALPDPTTKLDETVFKAKVEPVLAKQCSFDACHGNAGTALRVYVPGRLRATPPASLDEADLPLTAAEEHANYRSAAAFAIGIADPVDSWLLKKPLPESLGGYEHLGGAIFKSTSDSEFLAIYDWLRGVAK